MSSSSSPSGANKKKSMRELQEEITNLYNNIRLFEKGTKFFSGKFSSRRLHGSRLRRALGNLTSSPLGAQMKLRCTSPSTC